MADKNNDKNNQNSKEPNSNKDSKDSQKKESKPRYTLKDFVKEMERRGLKRVKH